MRKLQLSAVVASAVLFGLTVRQEDQETVEIEEFVVSPLGYRVGDIVVDGFQLLKHLDNHVLGGPRTSPGSKKKVALAELDASPKVAFPRSETAEIFKSGQEFLGGGGFGESWLVTGQPGTPYAGKQVVLKFLYIQTLEKPPKYAHLTLQQLLSKPSLVDKVREVVSECDFSRQLQKNGAEMTPETRRHGQRLMSCYDHNVKRGTPVADPLYLVLENCGKETLYDYLKRKGGALTAADIASITKQIVEGLQFLAAQPIPVIHHDLKPQNIVVKENYLMPDLVYLIDFGGMVHDTPEKQSRSCVATIAYAGPESRHIDNKDGQCFGNPGTAFDIFSLGQTLARMAIGREFSMMGPAQADLHMSVAKVEDYKAYLQRISEMSLDDFTAHFCPNSASLDMDEDDVFLSARDTVDRFYSCKDDDSDLFITAPNSKPDVFITADHGLQDTSEEDFRSAKGVSEQKKEEVILDVFKTAEMVSLQKEKTDDFQTALNKLPEESEDFVSATDQELPRKLQAVTSQFAHKCSGVAKMLEAMGPEGESAASKFITEYWLKMVNPEAGKRPTATDLLASEWLQNAASPDDPDRTIFFGTARAALPQALDGMCCCSRETQTCEDFSLAASEGLCSFLDDMPTAKTCACIIGSGWQQLHLTAAHPTCEWPR